MTAMKNTTTHVILWSKIVQFIHSELFIFNAYKQHRYVTMGCANMVEYQT